MLSGRVYVTVGTTGTGNKSRRCLPAWRSTSVRRTATFQHLDDGVAQVRRAERVEERVDGRVDVREPERGRVSQNVAV